METFGYIVGSACNIGAYYILPACILLVVARKLRKAL